MAQTKKQTQKTKKPVVKKTTAKKPATKKVSAKKPVVVKKPAAKKKSKKYPKTFAIFFVVLGFSVIGWLISLSIANQQFKKDIGVTKIEDYLYEVSYDEMDEEYAYKFMRDRYMPYLGSCSSVRNGNFIGRNYDWYYDNSSEFIIHVSAKEGRHASIGVANGTSLLPPETIDSGEYNDIYRVLPYLTLDGINDAGVAVNVNVAAPAEQYGPTVGTNPRGRDLPGIAVARYVLDNADSVDDAIAKLKNRNIFAAQSDRLVEEFHYMISDAEKTVVVEIINNELVVLEDENIMTNFYLTNFDKTEKTLPRYAPGIERYNILRDGLASATDLDSTMSLMKKVNYSKAYDLEENPFWYSEFSGIYEKYGDLNSTNFGAPYIGDNLANAGAYEGVVKVTQDYFANRNREDGTKVWQTVHTSAYDIANRTFKIVVQEGDTEHQYSL